MTDKPKPPRKPKRPLSKAARAAMAKKKGGKVQAINAVRERLAKDGIFM